MRKSLHLWSGWGQRLAYQWVACMLLCVYEDRILCTWSGGYRLFQHAYLAVPVGLAHTYVRMYASLRNSLSASLLTILVCQLRVVVAILYFSCANVNAFCVWALHTYTTKRIIGCPIFDSSQWPCFTGAWFSSLPTGVPWMWWTGRRPQEMVCRCHGGWMAIILRFPTWEEAVIRTCDVMGTPVLIPSLPTCMYCMSHHQGSSCS